MKWTKKKIVILVCLCALLTVCVFHFSMLWNKAMQSETMRSAYFDLYRLNLASMVFVQKRQIVRQNEILDELIPKLKKPFGAYYRLSGNDLDLAWECAGADQQWDTDDDIHLSLQHVIRQNPDLMKRLNILQLPGQNSTIAN